MTLHILIRQQHTKTLSFALLLLLFLAGNVAQVRAQAFQPVGDGIEHLQLIRGAKSAGEATGPFVIHFLRVDLRRVDIRLVHALDEAIGMETVSSLAGRYRAMAATNGGFFVTTGTYRGDCVSVLMVNGKLISEPINRRAAVGFLSQNGAIKLLFGHLQFAGAIELSGGRQLKLNGINRQRNNNEIILYTPEFHRTTLTPSDGLEVIVRRNRVVAVRDQTGSSRIPEDGFVLSASGSVRLELLQKIKLGMRVQIRTNLMPLEPESQNLWRQAYAIVGGAPQLIHNGRVEISNEAEGIREDFVTTRHPRTAIAELKDGKMLLVTVDGRQPGISAGMSLRQLADLLLEFGAVEAMNLDGGGSTTMVINNKLMNKPSDSIGERPVSDAILIFQKTAKRK